MNGPGGLGWTSLMRCKWRSVEIFSVRTDGLRSVDLRFLETIYLFAPEYPVRAPNNKILSIALGRSPGYASRRAAQAGLYSGDGEVIRGSCKVSAILNWSVVLGRGGAG